MSDEKKCNWKNWHEMGNLFHHQNRPPGFRPAWMIWQCWQPRLQWQCFVSWRVKFPWVWQHSRDSPWVTDNRNERRLVSCVSPRRPPREPGWSRTPPWSPEDGPCVPKVCWVWAWVWDWTRLDRRPRRCLCCSGHPAPCARSPNRIAGPRVEAPEASLTSCRSLTLVAPPRLCSLRI